MSSKRQQIVDVIVSRLGNIKTANGYSLTAKTVTSWRKTPLTIAELPCIIVHDGSCQVDYEYSSIGELTHQLQIDIWLATSGATTTSACRSGMSDIIKALGPAQHMGLDFDAWLNITGHDLTMEVEGDICGAGKVSITVTYISANMEI